MFYRVVGIAYILLGVFTGGAVAQNQPYTKEGGSGIIPVFDSSLYYTQVKTYVNPVLGGDHPDPTLSKIGDDFYMCGSTFHFTPYLPILHSKDLVHWEEISRVVSPHWTELRSDKPGSGIWQGAITYFYGSYWIYFSNSNSGGQYFCKGASPAGPWSQPIKVNTTSTTGPIGYDNSIFIDDDGTPYMLTKAGKPVNRIQKIGTDGHLTGDAINIDWINANGRYSWAEGPVMCKRDGWYYYTFARDVSGGQFVYRTKTLTSDSTQWQALGNFFAPITDKGTGFRVSNHMSAPFQLKDGTWWAIAQSYERYGNNDWSGQGRQSLLHRIDWDANGRPIGDPSSSLPKQRPALPKSGLPWLLPRSDYFNNNTLKLSWHFLNKDASTHYSFSKKGWLTLNPGVVRSHVLQKEGGHYYTLVTRVSIDADSVSQQGGIYVTNGNESVHVKLYSGYSDGKKIVFSMGKVSYQAENKIGKEIWLKLNRKEHDLSAYFSADGITWTQVGTEISAVNLDKTQPDYNSWVGTSIGLFAEGRTADFDLFIYKDGFSKLPVAGYNNFYGVQTIDSDTEKAVTNTSDLGGWLMLGGVDLGREKRVPQIVQVLASSVNGGKLEVWVDDLEGDGKRIATILVTSTGDLNNYKTFSAKVPALTGQHDVYLRFPAQKNAFNIKTIQFLTKKGD
ncbi:MAG: family 43 glycosylhydrolase [Candidatus Dadabacteria bacterium]